jgi:hypothetical protein
MISGLKLKENTCFSLNLLKSIKNQEIWLKSSHINRLFNHKKIDKIWFSIFLHGYFHTRRNYSDLMEAQDFLQFNGMMT